MLCCPATWFAPALVTTVVILLTLIPLPQLFAMAIFSPLTALGVRGKSLRLNVVDGDDISDDNGGGGKIITLPATVTVVALWHAQRVDASRHSRLGHF